MNFLKRNTRNMKGFTLVELLIVIGILAVLTAVVVIALNPVQNLAKTRDAGRLNTVTQLGHALEAAATSNNGVYVNLSATCAGATQTTWIACLGTAAGTGDINVVPSAVVYSALNPAWSGCFTGGAGSGIQSGQNGWCYKSGANGASPVIVYTKAEATANNSKCPAATPVGWIAYQSSTGKAGVVCTDVIGNEPAAGGTYTYY